MKYTIKKNKHQSRPFSLGLYLGQKKSYSKFVSFHENTEYNLNTQDQLDINKLFGYSLGIRHHKNSVRFGWRWNTEHKKIEILPYVYSSSARYQNHYQPIAYVNRSTLFKMNITRNKNSVTFSIIGIRGLYDNALNPTTKVEHTYVANFNNIINCGYYLKPYFGGTTPAPHKMSFKLT